MLIPRADGSGLIVGSSETTGIELYGLDGERIGAFAAGAAVGLDARYGAPKVVNCWNRPHDIPISARGRIDVGSGPGLRPCDAGGPLAANLVPASGKTAAGQNEEPKKP